MAGLDPAIHVFTSRLCRPNPDCQQSSYKAKSLWIASSLTLLAMTGRPEMSSVFVMPGLDPGIHRSLNDGLPGRARQ
jgi:hypothetical protein